MRFDFAEAPRERANELERLFHEEGPSSFLLSPSAQLSLVSFTSHNDFSAQSMRALPPSPPLQND